MTDEKWDELVGRIKDTFPVDDEYEEPLDEGPGTRRVIIFTSPSGKMKLEYVAAPVVIGTHGLGSKRIGSSATVAYEYSETERTNRLAAFRWEGDTWVEIQADALLGSASS